MTQPEFEASLLTPEQRAFFKGIAQEAQKAFKALLPQYVALRENPDMCTRPDGREYMMVFIWGLELERTLSSLGVVIGADECCRLIQEAGYDPRKVASMFVMGHAPW